MKVLRTITAAALVLLLCLGLCLPAFAADPFSGPADVPDWDTIVAALLEKYGVSETSVHLGYLNLVTGEEHYLCPDDYMKAASMFKLPLCMYVTELISSGELDMGVYEQYFTFEELRDRAIINSDNDAAALLLTLVGEYNEFRLNTAAYYGVEKGSEPVDITMYNQYTPRELINCLKLLYTERERFPGIIEAMQQATPARFFTRDEPRFRIAHKPGWINDYTEPNVMNDCGIAFTSQPIALVGFTSGPFDSESLLTEYCTAMCNYTEAMASIPEPTPEPTPEPAPEPTPVQAVTPEPVPAEITPAPAAASDRAALPPMIAAGAIVVFAVIGLVVIITLCAKYRARFIGLFLSLILSAAAMLLAVAGVRIGTVYARPSGDPAASVTRFFDAICAGSYDAAYRELRDYADLGLASVPGTPAGQKVYEALHGSFAWSLAGDCRTDKLEAVQPVRFRRLDLPSLEEAVAEETQRQVEIIVQARPSSQVYDENRRYRPEVANEAYLAALDNILRNADAYCVEETFDLALTYTDGRWQIVTSPALLRALAGGTAY